MASEWVSCACVNETLVNRTTINFHSLILKIIHQNNIQNTVVMLPYVPRTASHRNVTNQRL